MTDRLRRCWQDLVDEFEKVGAEPLDPEWLETLRHVFVVGMVSYRTALVDALDTPDTSNDAGEAIAEADLLDDELDALAVELRQELHKLMVKH
jgi:hypothetical protein